MGGWSDQFFSIVTFSFNIPQLVILKYNE